MTYPRGPHGINFQAYSAVLIPACCKNFKSRPKPFEIALYLAVIQAHAN